MLPKQNMQQLPLRCAMMGKNYEKVSPYVGGIPLTRGFSTSSCFPKNNFPKTLPKCVPGWPPFSWSWILLPTLLFGLYFVDHPLHPQTAPPALGKVVFSTIWSGFLDPINPNLKTIYLPTVLPDFAYQQYHSRSLGFGRTLPFVCWICVSPLIPGYRLVFFKSCNPSPTHWMNPFKKPWNKMSYHSFGNKGKSCKFSGRVFFVPSGKKSKRKRKDKVHHQPRLPRADWKQPNQTINRYPPSLGRFFFPYLFDLEQLTS